MCDLNVNASNERRLHASETQTFINSSKESLCELQLIETKVKRE